MSDEFTLPIESFTDHGDEWHVTLVGGEKLEVPQDTRNRHARAVLRHIQAGNQPANGEPGPRRRMRQQLRENPLWDALTKYLADELGHTPAQVRQGIISKL